MGTRVGLSGLQLWVALESEAARFSKRTEDRVRDELLSDLKSQLGCWQGARLRHGKDDSVDCHTWECNASLTTFHFPFFSQQPTRFSNRCLQMIGRCWPHLRALGVGGAGCGVQGLASLGESFLGVGVHR